jgi:hypothetical protein
MNTFTLSNIQINKLQSAIKNKKSCILEFSNQQLHGTDQLPLTKLQMKAVHKAKKSNKGIRLKLSKSQLLKKSGGMLPLAALLPLISGGMGAAAGAAGLIKNVKDLISSPPKKKVGKGLVLPRKRGFGLAQRKKQGFGMYLAPYKPSYLNNNSYKIGGKLKMKKKKIANARN